MPTSPPDRGRRRHHRRPGAVIGTPALLPPGVEAGPLGSREHALRMAGTRRRDTGVDRLSLLRAERRPVELRVAREPDVPADGAGAGTRRRYRGELRGVARRVWDAKLGRTGRGRRQMNLPLYLGINGGTKVG